MGRPRTPVGTFGRIKLTQDEGGWRARASFRDFDGKLRDVSRWATTQGKAESALKVAMTDRSSAGRNGEIRPETRLKAVAETFLIEMQQARLSTNTRAEYERAVASYIVPALGDLALREIDVVVVNGMLAAIRKRHGPGAAKMARTVLSSTMAVGVHAGAIPLNPVREARRIEQPRKEKPRSLTIAETERITDALRSDVEAVTFDVPDMVDWMLGTGTRIGETCAIRKSVLDTDASTVEINATIVRVKGAGLTVQQWTKTDPGWRVLALPSYVSAMVERRASESHRLRGPQGVLFAAPRGGLPDLSNVAGAIRRALDAIDCEHCRGTGWQLVDLDLDLKDPKSYVRSKAGHRVRCELGPYSWVVPHTFRKTVATRMDDAGMSARTIADQLGHARPSLTQDVYMGRKVVSAESAKVLDR